MTSFYTLVVVNPLHQNQAHRLWIQRQLSEQGTPYSLLKTTGNFAKDLAAIQAHLPELYHVIAIGGDGTFNLLANAMAGSDVPLSLVPCGTGNDFVRSLGITKSNWRTHVFGEKQQVIDLGKIGERYFANIAGFGFDTFVIKHAHPYPKWLRRYRYILDTMRSLMDYQPTDVVLTFDDGSSKHFKNFMTIFAKGQYFGGGLHIAPQSRCDDGALHLYMLSDSPWYTKLFAAIGLVFGKPLTIKELEYRQVKTVRLESSVNPIEFEVDGEFVQSPSLEIEVAAAALTIKKGA